MKFLIKMLVVYFVASAAFASKPPSTVVWHDPDENGRIYKTAYSQYFDIEQRSNDDKLLARLVITLGPERVPKGYVHTGRFADDLHAAYREGIVEWVSELYFINTSSETITVKPISLDVLDVFPVHKTFDVIEAINPDSTYITEPGIKLSSTYTTDVDVSFSYEYLGEIYQVKGIAKRLTKKEAKRKYGRH